MISYSFLDPELLEKALLDPLRPDEICWKPRDVEAGIIELTSHGKTIGAVSIYFKSADGVYCPVWGDCLMLPGGNTAYLNLLGGIDLDNDVTLGLICQVIVRFDLLTGDHGWNTNQAGFKESIASELGRYNIHDMYFCLQLD